MFTHYIMQLLKVKPKANLVASPQLLRFPLCKLTSVAKGPARQELMTSLGYKEESMLNSCFSRLKESIKTMAESDLTIVNRIYVNYSNDINSSFIANSTEKFGVQVEKVGFNFPKAAISYINRWVGTGTYKRITDILDAGDINKDTMMIIVNAVHFKGTWESPFDYRLTKLTKFRHIDGRISRVPMMTRTESFAYIAADDYKFLSMKFASWRAILTIVLPKTPQGLPEFLERIDKNPNYITSIVKRMPTTPVRIFIPRFKIKTYVDWTGFLQELGITTIFSRTSSGLSAILKNDSETKNIALSRVKQKLFIQVDEMGVARFTRNPNRNLGPPKVPLFIDVPEFVADRPFYFQITLDFENARYEMFTGVYYGPEPEKVNKI
ncbi:serine protease inhibitor 3/4-like isoform X2 [Trichoplusia ni]|uniref:Serine protease inhibitor 3/4-like isoform X2 n=1 Tax=Trichoplusia ni TaxID=7111 RepID=A0A7E5X4R2_TRINI|nr:serine protease inhibitor 3/4-like isoform X2 [Trichoplusia ni]XP_026747452.1 serine protease inhibitor 3/4-like isoform X2 [Trichoplusia ni]